MNIERIKYPRTFHLPWSPGVSSDDKIIGDIKWFNGKRMIITEKMDGENSTMARDYYHARSVDSKDHPSRSWLKRFHAHIAHEIPKGWRICGENMYARHSIPYDDLQSYFYCFSIWNDKNMCLSWDDTVEWCKLLNMEHVPVLHESFIWDEFTSHWMSDHDAVGFDPLKQEGYVVRNVNTFHYRDFGSNVAKYVRKNHVQTNEHWMHSKVIPNRLAPIY